MDRSRRNRTAAVGFAAIAIAIAVMTAALAWAALAPIRSDSRDYLFTIPKGTWERRMAGEKLEILPSRITLMLGVRDVLVLRNSDTVPQIFGSVLIMPDQVFRMPFEVVSENQFDCAAHASGQMTVAVEPMPAAGWPRLKWRLTSPSI